MLLTLRAFLKVFAHKETCSEETSVERGVKRCLSKLEGGPQLGVGLQFVWGGTLYHLDDLPFSTAELPDVYTQFRKVKQVFLEGLSIDQKIFLAVGSVTTPSVKLCSNHCSKRDDFSKKIEKPHAYKIGIEK